MSSVKSHLGEFERLHLGPAIRQGDFQGAAGRYSRIDGDVQVVINVVSWRDPDEGCHLWRLNIYARNAATWALFNKAGEWPLEKGGSLEGANRCSIVATFPGGIGPTRHTLAVLASREGEFEEVPDRTWHFSLPAEGDLAAHGESIVRDFERHLHPEIERLVSHLQSV